MSMPHCLTNPTLRLYKTPWGFVTLERTAPQDYRIFKDGVYLGRATKFKSWLAEGDKAAYKTRDAAIGAAIVGWYQRAKATGSAA